MPTSLVLVVAAVLIILAVGTDSWRRLRLVEKAFANRSRLGPKQFYERYFEGKGIPRNIVEGVRSVLEEQLSADLSRLADSDDFSKNLKFFWDFDSMADVAIVCALEEKFHIKISDAEAQQTHTVADIVSLIHRKVRERSAP